jgi:hypothetical protein
VIVLEPAIEEFAGGRVKMLSRSRWAAMSIFASGQPCCAAASSAHATADVGRHCSARSRSTCATFSSAASYLRIGFGILLRETREFRLGPPRRAAQLEIGIGEREEVADRRSMTR